MRVISYIGLGLICAIPASGVAQGTSGSLDFNVYPYLGDVDTSTSFTLNIAANLSERLSYFSLNNLNDEDGDGSYSDGTAYFMEHNLRWELGDDSPLDLTFQTNIRKGSKNNRHRLGLRWRLNDTSYMREFFARYNLSYFVNFHPVQFDHEDAHVWQIEHVFRLQLPQISDRIYISGFVDHTFNEDLPSGFPSAPFVAEVQAGYRIAGDFYVVAEHRLNEYRRSDVNNFTLGVEYIARW
ncbi:MAG: hypothetical protein R3332_03170 [Pseudohongiellaceae bacterium]|nr:hypothetical protein [Pseudohongiellaceae bacterium]